MEIYLAGISGRKVRDITEALWCSRVSPNTISDQNKMIFERVEAWCNRAIEQEHPYIFVEGIWLKRTWGGEVENSAYPVVAQSRALQRVLSNVSFVTTAPGKSDSPAKLHKCAKILYIPFTVSTLRRKRAYSC